MSRLDSVGIIKILNMNRKIGEKCLFEAYTLDQTDPHLLTLGRTSKNRVERESPKGQFYVFSKFWMIKNKGQSRAASVGILQIA